jgi:hypothetical protein
LAASTTAPNTQPSTARITNISRYYGVIGQWKNPGAVWFRNTLFRLWPKKAAAKGYVTFVGYDPYEVSMNKC